MELTVQPNFMVEVEPGKYLAGNGHSAQREEGLTPKGNPISGRWVLRDANGDWLDFHQYRHDLFEHHELRPHY